MVVLGSRGQVAIEQLILTAFLLVVTIVLFGYSFISINESSRLQVALQSVRELSSAADTVSVLGNGNSIVVDTQIPDNVESFSVIGKSIAMRINQISGINDIVEYSVGDITPLSLPTTYGFYKIKVEAVDENVVFSVVP